MWRGLILKERRKINVLLFGFWKELVGRYAWRNWFEDVKLDFGSRELASKYNFKFNFHVAFKWPSSDGKMHYFARPPTPSGKWENYKTSWTLCTKIFIITRIWWFFRSFYYVMYEGTYWWGPYCRNIYAGPSIKLLVIVMDLKIHHWALDVCNIIDGWSRVWCNPHRIIVHFGVTIYLNYLQLKTFTHNQTKTWTLDYTVACLLREWFIKTP